MKLKDTKRNKLVVLIGILGAWTSLVLIFWMLGASEKKIDDLIKYFIMMGPIVYYSLYYLEGNKSCEKEAV